MDLIREHYNLAVAAQSAVDLKHVSLGDEFYYSCLPLCVIDSVYSIGVKYEAVRNTVRRFCDREKLNTFRLRGSAYPPRNEQLSIENFIDICKRHTPDDLASAVFGNRQRTSATNGILKAQAALEFAEVLASNGISYCQDVPKLSLNEHVATLIKLIKGQKSGISFSYFLMLSGDDSKIKPDRMLVSFAETALQRKCRTDELQGLYVGACDILKSTYLHLTPRLLDYAVWNYQRSTQK
jgi:hypothetical protein